MRSQQGARLSFSKAHLRKIQGEKALLSCNRVLHSSLLVGGKNPGLVGKHIENSTYIQGNFPGTVLEQRNTAQKHYLSYRAPDPKSTNQEPFQPLMPAE